MTSIVRLLRSIRGPSVRSASLAARTPEILDTDELIEEEILPRYCARNYYPVHIGETFNDRYQVVAKLGFGASSTVWLARDIGKYVLV